MAANSGLGYSEEYESCEDGAIYSREAAKLIENKYKNRFANILPYDYTRIRLSLEDGVLYSDYVNASYVNGYHEKHSYIAAQGPLPSSVSEFWRLIWETNTLLLIMLTNCEEKGRAKCHQYWPLKPDEPMHIGVWLILNLTAEEVFPDYIIRTIRASVSGTNVTRVIKQFHYIAWPDHGVPDSTDASLAILKKTKVRL